MLLKPVFLCFLIGLLVNVPLKALEPKRFADSMEKIVSQTGNKKQKIEILLAGSKKLRLLDPDKALDLSTWALSIAGSKDYPELRLQAMINIGNIDIYKSKYKEAMEIALKVKELSTQLENKKALGESFMLIGAIKVDLGDYSESYESFFNALRLFEQVAYSEGIIKALSGISNTCYYQGNYNKALIYDNNALKVAMVTKDSLQLGMVMTNVGVKYAAKNQFSKAIDFYQKAIAINMRLGLQTRLAALYLNIGTAYLQLNRYDDFILYYNRAMAFFTVTEAWHSVAVSHLQYSAYYKKLKDPENELKYVRLALSESMKYKFRRVAYQAAGALHMIYLSEGKIDSAYKYSLLEHAEKDTLNSEKAQARLSLFELEYNYNNKQQEIKIKQQRKDFIVIIIIIIALSGLITTILFLSRQIVKTKNIRLEKQRLSDEVEFKNKELTLGVMNLIKKNELIVDISNRLILMEQNTTDPSFKQEIIQLIRSLQRNSSEEIWEEFEVRFKQVHNSFYKSLLDRFPNLSPSELKLCALLRLNLSTKEICELSGQRPASLDVARYRLRKKLGIANSQVSLVTFLSQV